MTVWSATPWSAEMDDQLRALWGTAPMVHIAATMGLSFSIVRNRSKKLRLELPKRFARSQPTKEEWTRVAREHAIAAHVGPSEVMGGGRRRAVLIARWKAWEATLALNPKYSVNGLARISGFDHTTIMSAMKRLPFIADAPLGDRGKEPATPDAVKPRTIRLLVPLDSVPDPVQAYYKAKASPANINIGPDMAARRVGARA